MAAPEHPVGGKQQRQRYITRSIVYTLGRAPGVQVTFTLNVPLLAVVLVRLAQGWAA